MSRKCKKGLLVMCILFITICVITSIYYHPRYAQDFYHGCPNCLFEEGDSTMLLVTMQGNVPPYIMGREVLSYLKFLILAVAIIMSVLICILNIADKVKQKFASFFYLGSCLFPLLLVAISLKNTDQGINNLFRKASVSYQLGLVRLPWLLYYLMVLLPIIITIGLLIYDLKKNSFSTNNILNIRHKE